MHVVDDSFVEILCALAANLEEREDAQRLAMGQHGQALVTRQVHHLEADRWLARVLYQHLWRADPARMLQHEASSVLVRPVYQIACREHLCFSVRFASTMRTIPRDPELIGISSQPCGEDYSLHFPRSLYFIDQIHSR